MMTRWIFIVAYCASLIGFGTPPAPALSLSPQSEPPRRSSPSPGEAALIDGPPATMVACLAVARDRRADALWRSEAFAGARASSAPGVVDALAGMPGQQRLKLGFGTVRLCAGIVRAWYGRRKEAAELPSMDEAVVVDLSLPRRRPASMPRGRPDAAAAAFDHLARGSIDAGALVRVASAKGLLPDSAYGGLRLEHADIQGTLNLRNAEISRPLMLVDVRLLGSDDVALRIGDSDFEGDVTVDRSLICGDVRIHESRFAKGIEFVDVTQTDTGCAVDDLAGGAGGASLHVEASTIGQSLKTVRSAFGGLAVIGNEIGGLLSSRASFGGSLRVIENRITSVQMDCSMLPRASDISYNQIERDLFVYGSRHRRAYDCEGHWTAQPAAAAFPPAAIRIVDNRIGGGLGFTEFDGGLVDAVVDLSGNDVGAGSDIEIPAMPWRGTLDLGGSVFDGSLRVGVTGPVDEEAGPLHYCRPLGQARAPDAAVVSMRVTEVNVLTWDVPLTCAIRWSGAGLAYKLWLAGVRTLSSLRDPDRADTAFLEWRKTMVDFDRAALEAMSTYLASSGSYNGSRKVLLDAKRLNYAPGCAPDWSAGTCAVQMLIGDGDDAWLARALEGAGSAAWIAFLWPVGYGAVPERAIVLLLFGAVAFAVVYAGYSRRLKRDLMQVPNYLVNLRRLRRTSQMAEAALKRRKGEDGAPAESDGEPPDLISGLIDVWPTRAIWRKLDMEDRIEMIRDDLLPEIERCKVEIIAHEPTRVKRLHRRLERFAIKRIGQRLKRYGRNDVLGFDRYHSDDLHDRFSHWRYSLDNMIPIIDLHARTRYFPISGKVRVLAFMQYLCGWWWLSLFSYFTSSASL